jgi:hypothetical protein
MQQMVCAMVLVAVLAGCAGRRETGETRRVDARRACLELARDRNLDVTDVERIEPLGRQRYAVDLRLRVPGLGAESRRCTYNARTGTARL